MCSYSIIFIFLNFFSIALTLQVLCVDFEGIACFDALLIDLEEVAIFSCDMRSLGK